LRVADAAALHIDSDAYTANTYSMRVYAELSDANTLYLDGQLSDADADADCYALRRSSVSYPNPNPYSLHRSGLRDTNSYTVSGRRKLPNPYSLRRRGLRDADTHTVSGRRELPNADGDPDSYPDSDADGYPDPYPDSDTLSCAGPV
jgi:hypothetical protein